MKIESKKLEFIFATGKAALCPGCNVVSTFTLKSLYEDKSILGVPFKELSAVRIWECNCCSQIAITVQHGKTTQQTRVWPSGYVTLKDEMNVIPKNVLNDFNEALSILNLSPAASAAISRRCLQAILKDKYPDKLESAKKLKFQIKAILDANIFPQFISEELHGIRSIGNNAAHPNVDPRTNEIVEVDGEEASACLDVLRSIIDFCYIDPEKSRLRKIEREAKYGEDMR